MMHAGLDDITKQRMLQAQALSQEARGSKSGRTVLADIHIGTGLINTSIIFEMKPKYMLVDDNIPIRRCMSLFRCWSTNCSNHLVCSSFMPILKLS